MQLKNKTILIVSPQSWGKMFLSKHHYAVTLARQGNKVYFLNPPKQGRLTTGSIQIVPTSHENLSLVHHEIRFPFNVKFHAIPIFHWLMEIHIKKVLKRINQPLDIVWSFDQLNLYPFSFFDKRTLKLFHPVDEPGNKNAINAAKGCDVIVSVTDEILAKYRHCKKPMFRINHGIDENFFYDYVDQSDKKNIRVGFSGNLLRRDIDRDIFLQIVKENRSIIFECWGSYRAGHTNIGGSENARSKSFIEALQKYGVILHGPVTSDELGKELQRMDAFLICYDVQKDPSKGTNYHKIMEYLSTGKVIISNNITSYQSNPDLVQMVKEREDNSCLPELFKKVISNLDFYNSPGLLDCRKKFARANTYTKHIEKIESILGERILQLTISNVLLNIA